MLGEAKKRQLANLRKGYIISEVQIIAQAVEDNKTRSILAGMKGDGDRGIKCYNASRFKREYYK